MKEINTESEDFTAPKARILLIDDSKVTLTIERDLIKKYCYNVTTASSGSEAIKLLCSGNSYNIIFIDYMMPDMDGSETAFRIRNIPQFEDSILIMLTASSKDSLEPHIIKEFTDFLEKPVNLENIKKILLKYLPKEIINKSDSETKSYLSYIDKDIKFNFATLGVYEAGSVFKVFNTALGLDSGKIKITDSFDATKPLKMGRHKITDYRVPAKWLTEIGRAHV